MVHARAGGALVMAALVFAACADRPVARDRNGGSNVTTTPCHRALAPLVGRELASLRGLPAGCTPDDVAAVLGPSGSPSRGRLGDPARDIELRFYRVDGWKQEVRGWYEHGQLILVDVDRPDPSGGWQAFVHSLGEPDGRLDYAWRIHSLRDAEWIYASRGLAVVVKPDPGLILRLTLFAPTTVDTYAHNLRFISEYREEE
jgi:hypothetical protein